MPPNIGRVWWPGLLPNWGIVGWHGEHWEHYTEKILGSIQWHLVTETSIVTLSLSVTRNPWHYKSLSLGLGNVSWCSIPQSCRDTCYAAELTLCMQWTMSQLLLWRRFSASLGISLLPNWLETPQNLIPLVIISYSLIIISFMNPFLSKAVSKRSFLRKNANLPISYF